MSGQFLQARAVAYIIAFGAACILPVSAWAGALTNMDERAYTFNAQVGGEMQEVTIEPGETWRTHAGVPVLLFADNGKLKIYPNEEYAIWKGGKILLQKRVGTGSNDN